MRTRPGTPTRVAGPFSGVASYGLQVRGSPGPPARRGAPPARSCDAGTSPRAWSGSADAAGLHPASCTRPGRRHRDARGRGCPPPAHRSRSGLRCRAAAHRDPACARGDDPCECGIPYGAAATSRSLLRRPRRDHRGARREPPSRRRARRTRRVPVRAVAAVPPVIPHRHVQRRHSASHGPPPTLTNHNSAWRDHGPPGRGQPSGRFGPPTRALRRNGRP